MTDQKMEQLVNVLKEELYDCQLLYKNAVKASDLLALTEVWKKILEPVWDFPGDEHALREAFLSHRQRENKFPQPAVIYQALLGAKPKLREPFRPAKKAFTEGMPENVLAALRGDQQALAWCRNVWGG